MDVYALQEERLMAGAPLLTTVQDIAEYFVREILARRPIGPYFLAGQCEGSVVALEIARQLQRKGHEIGALIQFDTPVTGYFQKLPLHKRISWALARGKNIFTLITNKLSRIFTAQTPSTESYIWNVIWSAVRAYGTDKIFEGEIIIFRAEQIWPLENVAVGWDRLGAVKIYDVPGDHVRFFLNPTAQGIIRQVLEDVQQRRPEVLRNAR
jgi:surfactin synthase thioesterase subunit